MRSLVWLAVVMLCGSAAAQPVLTEDAKLVGSDADSVATAGWAIAAAEGFVVLGAFRDDSTPTTGAAYVFRETADGWKEEAKLSASEQSFFTFGMAVGAWSDGREDLVIAGARGTFSQSATDAAYIFRRTGEGVWTEEKRLTNGPDEQETFGNAVAIHGDYAVVGALGADDLGEATGAAYVFTRTTEGVWEQEARLQASDAAALSGFGRGVAVIAPEDGPPLTIIGAPSDNDQTGAAYAFRRESDGTWTEEAKLLAPGGEPSDLFGLDVAASVTSKGEVLALAGALGDNDSGTQSGAGYVFRRSTDGTWTFEEKLTAANGRAGKALGWSVALAAAPEVGADAVAVLGARDAYNLAGTVRLFRRTVGEAGPVWIEEAELWASDRAPGDEIGQSVGVSGRFAVAGAPNNDGEDSPAGRGAGYVWDLQRAVPVEPSTEASEGRVRLTVYPNPAVGESVMVQLQLPAAADVRLDAFDVLGREVAVLHDGPLAAGRHAFRLPTATLPSGVYLLRLSGDASSVTRRVVVLR